jgi:hypothetical protein
MARKGLGAAEWAKLIDRWEQSGLSLPRFCREHGIKKGTMSGWVYKPALRSAIERARRGEGARPDGPATAGVAPASAPSPAFVPVRLREIIATSAPEPADRRAIEVVLAEGRRVAVGPGFDPETLRRVVAALEA